MMKNYLSINILRSCTPPAGMSGFSSRYIFNIYTKAAVLIVFVTSFYAIFGPTDDSTKLRIREDTSRVFRELQSALETVRPWPGCPHISAVGGRCLTCKLKLSNTAAEFDTFGQRDGAKPVCLDLLTPHCRVLSFGINYDFSFDESMQDLGCRVHAFDPSMQRSSVRPPAGVEFHGVGLGTIDHLSDSVPVATLHRIVRDVGLQHGVIDYIKLDIEASEWEVLRQQLHDSGDLLRTRQLAVEFHLYQWESELYSGMQNDTQQLVIGIHNAERFLQVLRQLAAAGFRLVHNLKYKYCQNYGNENGCLRFIYENLYVNTRLL